MGGHHAVALGEMQSVDDGCAFQFGERHDVPWKRPRAGFGLLRRHRCTVPGPISCKSRRLEPNLPVTLTGAAWQPAAGTAGQAAPCRPGPAQPGGQPSGALLASTSASLVLLCTGPSAGGQQSKAVYTSTSGGRTWQRTGQAPAAGTAVFLSGSPSGGLVLATSLGIEVSTDGGASWSAAGGTVPPGGFAYVGMTTAAQGVAIPAAPARSTVWLTYDGGSTWAPSSASA